MSAVSELRTLHDLWELTGYVAEARPPFWAYRRAAWEAAERAALEGGRLSIPDGPLAELYHDAPDEGCGVRPFAW